LTGASIEGHTSGTLRGVDLYDRARIVPALLRGSMTATSPRAMVSAGMSQDAIRWRADRGTLRRVHRGSYLRGGGTPDLLDAIHAALVVSPPHAVIGFHTAAQLLGFGVTPSDEIHIVVPAGTTFPQRRGITVHQSVIPIGEPVEMLGVPCTPAARCAIDLVRSVRRLDALPILDAALRARACDLDDLLAEVKLHDGLRGVRQARDLASLADPRPQCRQESQLRLVIVDGGVKGFEPQVPVEDDLGVVRYVIDLADPRSMVGAEYDGASHLDRSRLRGDRARHNWLENLGWRMRYFTDHDLYQSRDSIIHTLNSARQPRKPRQPRQLPPPDTSI